ncbi:glycosyltransferase family 2 protein [Sodalis sp. dw_96]|uniref:glycosyltransferase family 2 protein n=1 Tax=Sodalis sp. dw_96 TaxID=2719794 RepID=UPI001BD2DDBE|nr:glycosyltransferase family 2 protein [Sodalis sp. dw_96]
MDKISICLLTYNSDKLLHEVIKPILLIADEIIVVDSGSTDNTLSICRQYTLSPVFNPYITHAQQMNFAISLATHDWVLCLDSDEIADDVLVNEIKKLKNIKINNIKVAYRIPRYWFVLNEPVKTMYPISSPDYPIRLFNRQSAKFNNSPVDDAVEGALMTLILNGRINHYTFHSIHEIFSKLNTYTTRLVKYKDIKPSLARGIISAIGAFFKWYIFTGAWKKGKVGVVTGTYATLYSFLKYFKAWYYDKH